MYPDFFPDHVSFALAETWMWETPAFPDEEKLLSITSALKRQREFRAGRHCAHLVLQQLGYKDFSVMRGKQGEPLWPADICGSISHAGKRCIAIAANKKNYLSIAVDIERNRLIKDETLERIANKNEQEDLLQAPEIFSEVNTRAILFSIIACIHKSYYPLNGYTLDFLRVNVAFDGSTHLVDIDIIRPPKKSIHNVIKLVGHFGYDQDYVFSRICLCPDMSCA